MKTLFAFVVLFSFVLPFKASAVEQTVPMISARQLRPAAFWIWNYYVAGDPNQLHAREKYTVTNVNGDLVTFDITTQNAGTTGFTPSARFTVKLSDCLNAFKSGRQRFFTIELQGYANGRWSEAYEMKSLAFEEKFNCNPIQYRPLHPLFRTNFEDVVTAWGSARVFQQKRVMPSQVLSYYFADFDELTGVAFKKEFNGEGPYSYGMELSETSALNH